MSKFKTAARCALFLAILSFVSVNIFNVLTWKSTEGIIGLYNLPKDRVDVLFLGSSHSYCTVNTAQLWEEHGIAAADISEAAQVFPIEYHYLREALKTQRPKVVCMELYGFDRNVHIASGAHFRNSLNMKWSKNYVENANYIIGNISSRISGADNLNAIIKAIYLKFPVIHSRYKELTENDFGQNNNALRFQPNWSSREYTAPEALNEKGVAALTDEQRKYLDSSVELSKQYGCELILWVAPSTPNEERAMQYNAIKQYALENGVTFYNMHDYISELGFDYATDLRDEGESSGNHINSNGAQKVTRYLGKLLAENYDLQDRRGDPEYAFYDRAARQWDVEYALHSMELAENLQDYLKALDTDLMQVSLIRYDSRAQWPKGAAIEALLNEKTNIDGLYTDARWNNLNGVWELSDRVKLRVRVKDGVINNVLLYNGSLSTKINDCKFAVIVVDRETGRLLNKAEFNGSGDSTRRL